MTFEEAIQAEVDRVQADITADYGDRVRNRLDLLFGSRKQPKVFVGLQALIEADWGPAVLAGDWTGLRPGGRRTVQSYQGLRKRLAERGVSTPCR